MIAAIEGVIYEYTDTKLMILTSSGLVYELLASKKLIDDCAKGWGSAGEPIVISTQAMYREDSQLLFGFSDDREKKAFNLLLSASGIGGKYALSIIDQVDSIDELYQAIVNSDTQYLVKLKGVGLSKAKTIIKHLKKKVSNIITL